MTDFNEHTVDTLEWIGISIVCFVAGVVFMMLVIGSNGCVVP